MQITQEQYEKKAKHLPRQRGNVSMSNLQLINAILYVTENGCKWRALPEAYGNWHTIYVRMNRWSKNGVLSRVFAALQTEGIVQINVEVLYKRRNEVERFFRRIKRFRRVFTRYDKLDIIFAGFILFAMIFDSLVGTDSKSSRRKGYCYYENPSDQNLLSLFSSYSTAAYSPFACRNFGSCFHLCSTASASA